MNEEDKSKIKQRDSYRNNFYDSRVIIYMPSVIKRVKLFLNTIKMKKES